MADVVLFNFGKCKCLHTWPGNTGTNYEMGRTMLNHEGKRLRGNNECSEQCRIASSQGNQVLGMIRRNIT